MGFMGQPVTPGREARGPQTYGRNGFTQHTVKQTYKTFSPKEWVREGKAQECLTHLFFFFF